MTGPLRDYGAANELHRVANASAFCVVAMRRDKLNQHATLYTFLDGSQMQVNHTRGRADAWHPDWRGTAADTHLGPLKGVALNINARGKA